MKAFTFISTKKRSYNNACQIMQVFYRGAFVVASALCPTLISGGARAPPGYMAPSPLSVSH